MRDDLPNRPEYRHTLERLQQVRREGSKVEYWLAREVQPILGYDRWENFEGVIARAEASLRQVELDPSHHIAETTKMMRVGNGATRRVRDLYLTRAACYLIAMNGDPSKPEIAAAQAYFAVKTRSAELAEERSEDEKRLELRKKVKTSFRAVSGVAQDAGVKRQGLFHDARYQGLYQMSLRDLKSQRGLTEKEQPFDRMGALELSANDFQMNLAAETIRSEGTRGEAQAIAKNKEIARRVRHTMLDSGSVPPEQLSVAEPIKQVEKRLKAQSKLPNPPAT